MDELSRKAHLRRGIYLLPTLFTVANLFCGFSSLIQSARGNPEWAAVLIFVAAILDGLDGRIARLTGTTSAFGLEFDSLADIVSFGIAPALLAYHWALYPLGRTGWLVAFLYVVCAAMRLARFNIRTALATDKRHFAGLPSPMAGSVLAAIAFAFPQLPRTNWLAISMAFTVFAVALLMISRLRYRSFKELDVRNRRSYIYVLPMAAALVAVAYHPKGAMLLLFSAYLLSAPLLYVWGIGRRGALHPKDEVAADAEVADEPALR